MLSDKWKVCRYAIYFGIFLPSGLQGPLFRSDLLPWVCFVLPGNPEGSHSLGVSLQQPTSRDRKRPFCKMRADITKGTEKVRISLLNESGKEQLPNFNYMPENTVYQNAYIHFALARIADTDCCSSCLGDCLSLPVPCECAGDTGGEFAYTSKGLLREEFLNKCISMNEAPREHYQVYCIDCPLERAKNEHMPAKCKGHLVRKFIKECWRKCGCDMLCGNRVVQRGISRELQVSHDLLFLFFFFLASVQVRNQVWKRVACSHYS